MTVYHRQGKGRIPLRFSVSGASVIEKFYSTHYVLPLLARRTKEEARKAQATPEEEQPQ